METYLVYMHKCLINRKVYIGITNNPERRWRSNGIEYKPPKKEKQTARSFWNAIQKYGWDNFEHIILQENLSFEDAINLEIEYIKEYDSANKNYGYNISKGGNGGKIYEEHPRGMLGKRHSQENKDKHSEWLRNNKNNCMKNGQVIWGETHEHPKGMLGKNHTEEHKEKLKQKTGYSASFRKEVKCTMPSGEVIEFPSVKFCAIHLGLSSSSSVIVRCLKTKEPYKIRPGTSNNLDLLKTLEGLKLEYI